MTEEDCREFLRSVSDHLERIPITCERSPHGARNFCILVG